MEFAGEKKKYKEDFFMEGMGKIIKCFEQGEKMQKRNSSEETEIYTQVSSCIASERQREK